VYNNIHQFQHILEKHEILTKSVFVNEK
jgi:hypothetical protein